MMRVDSTRVMLSRATKFFRNVNIFGWYLSDLGHPLKEIEVEGIDAEWISCSVGILHEGVAAFGRDKGFIIEAIVRKSQFPIEAKLHFIDGVGERVTYLLRDLVEEQVVNTGTSHVSDLFRASVYEKAGAKLLDIGGRDRSKVDRRKDYPGVDVTVIDILKGDNVDVVGDAHRLSEYFPPKSFDFFMCISVIEHILMPWKLAIEANYILKPGGVGLVHTHQTLGMHDIPWDFWRFSDESWRAIFNKYTGFEIVEARMGHESFILPFFWRPDKSTAENSAGYESSSVLVRKVGEPSVSWPVDIRDIVETGYPDVSDGAGL